MKRHHSYNSLRNSKMAATCDKWCVFEVDLQKNDYDLHNFINLYGLYD